MSYEHRKRASWPQWELDEAEEPLAHPLRSPGKRTLTMGLPPRSVGALAPVQQKAAPAAVTQRKKQAALSEQWMDVALRPDLHDAPVQRKSTGDHEHDQASTSLPADSGGQTMPEDVQAKMEGAFGADLSAVRIHEGPQATAMGALAYTQGTDIHFAPGLYDPGSQSGQELLGHELTHVVQQSRGRVRATTQTKGVDINADAALEREADEMGTRAARSEAGPEPSPGPGSTPQVTRSRSRLANAPIRAKTGSGGERAVVACAAEAHEPAAPIQRREVANNDAAVSEPFNWTLTDRQNKTDRWKNACLYNLENLRSGEYTRIEERRDFYWWFYEYHAARGYTTRWALAAAVVASGAYQVAYQLEDEEISLITGELVTPELEGFMRIGNQVIFDNVFPKLKELHDRAATTGPLVGRAALEWDMQILSEEQQLVQGLYSSMSSTAQALMARIAKQQGMVGVGAWLFEDDHVAGGPHHREGDVPAFPGNASLTSVDARWQYGMSLGAAFAPTATGFNPATDQRPQPGPSYMAGGELAGVNRRPNLHRLDAIVFHFSGDVSITDVRSILQALSENEKTEFARDSSPDGRQYSSVLAMMPRVPRAEVVAALPSTGPERDAFLANYNRLRPSWAP